MALSPVPSGYFVDRVEGNYDVATDKWTVVALFALEDNTAAPHTPVTLTEVTTADAATSETVFNALMAAADEIL